MSGVDTPMRLWILKFTVDANELRLWMGWIYFACEKDMNLGVVRGRILCLRIHMSNP